MFWKSVLPVIAIWRHHRLHTLRTTKHNCRLFSCFWAFHIYGFLLSDPRVAPQLVWSKCIRIWSKCICIWSKCICIWFNCCAFALAFDPYSLHLHLIRLLHLHLSEPARIWAQAWWGGDDDLTTWCVSVWVLYGCGMIWCVRSCNAI